MLRQVAKRFGFKTTKGHQQSSDYQNERSHSVDQTGPIPGSVSIAVFDEPKETGRSWNKGEGQWTFDDFLAEAHHGQYGRPWCIGRGYLEFLIENGLKPQHRLLDFGCGAGRLGILLIPFLEKGHYFGIDRHFGSLDAFARYEIPAHRLAEYQPRLALSDALRLDGFGETFDVVLDLYASLHMADALSFYKAAVTVLNPNGRIFVPHLPKPSINSIENLGLKLVHTEVRPAFLLSNRSGPPPANRKQWSTTDDHWHILQRIDS